MRHSTSLPITFRIVALFTLSVALLAVGSLPVTGQPVEDPAHTSTPNSGPSFTVAVLGPIHHSSAATARAGGTDVPEPVVLDPPAPSMSGLPPAAMQSRLSRRVSYSRWAALWSEFASPTFLLGSFGPAVGDHLNDDPASWRDDALGYGFRVASNAGASLIEGSLAQGLAAATRLDLRFRPRGHGSVTSRLRYAVLEAVTARTASGTRVPNAPRLAGTYGAVLAQQRWQSGEVRPGDAALSTALSVGIDAAINVISEFAGSR